MRGELMLSHLVPPPPHVLYHWRMAQGGLPAGVGGWWEACAAASSRSLIPPPLEEAREEDGEHGQPIGWYVFPSPPWPQLQHRLRAGSDLPEMAGDDISSRMVRFDDEPLGDRIQTCLNRGVSGLSWTNKVSLQRLPNTFQFGIGVT